MKKWLATALGGALIVAGVAALWPSCGDDAAGEVPRVAEAQPLPEFERVEISSSTPSGLAVTGIVRDGAGRPLADAEVFIASSSQTSMVTVRCSVCEQPLLACGAQSTLAQLTTLLHQQVGHLQAGASTRSDGEGRFRFDDVSGVSFTVWASAPGHGAAIHERAAPNDPVELFLPATRAIAGRVTDEAGAPVADAHVHVVSHRIPLPLTVTTSTTGTFDVHGLGEGPFYVLVDREGFLPVDAHSVEAGAAPLQLKLSRPRTLEVEVRKNGELADALVQVSGDHLELSAPAKDGLARIEGLAHRPVAVMATAGPDGSPTREVMLDQPVTRIRLDLDVAGKLAVTVVDQSGQPVPDPKLILSRAVEDSAVLEKRVRTGELAFLGPVPVGDYVLAAEAQSFEAAELPVRVTPGELSVEVVMKKATLIRGRVMDVYGRPAPGISILINPTGTSVNADERGNFEAPVPSPGFYELQAHHSDWGGGEAQVTAPADGVELHLEPKAGLKVTVSSEGRRLEGADVMLWSEGEATFRNDRPSGSDGVVMMRGLPAGAVMVVALHRDFLPSDRKQVTLRDGDLLDLSFELQAGAKIAGKVVDESGAPVVGASVSAIPRGAPPQLTDSQGAFELKPLREGRPYRIEAMHQGFDQKDRVIASAGGEPVTITLQRRNLYRGRVVAEDTGPMKMFRVDDQPVTSADGSFELPLPSENGKVIAVFDAPGYQAQIVDQPAEQMDFGTITLAREPQVSGVVKDANGAPVDGATVGCDACDVSAQTDASGRFAISVPPHLASAVVMASKGGLTGTLSANLRSKAPLEIVLRQAVRLTGRVFNANGEPAAGAELEAVHIDRSEPYSAVTMQDGSYSLELPEGNYRFSLPRASRPFAGEPVTFAYVGGEATRLDLGAAPGTGGLAVHVTPQPGFALWAVRGVVGQVGNPPLELFKAEYAQMVYQPRAQVVNLSGLPPGRYTLVWSRFHAQSEGGPQLQVVDVPGPKEVSFK